MKMLQLTIYIIFNNMSRITNCIENLNCIMLEKDLVNWIKLINILNYPNICTMNDDFYFSIRNMQ